MLFQHKQTILFQGDSITDCNRERSDPFSMGNGYAQMASALFSAMHPQKEIHFLNRGISGNRVPDLLDRWEEDTIALKPDWISLLIGINDVWRRYDCEDPTPVETFTSSYRKLLKKTKEAMPDVGLIIVEPFVLPFPEDRIAWREDLDPKIQAIREIVREFGATYIALDGLFASACAYRPPAFWAPDGVHPSAEGHALIAEAWLRSVKAWS